MNLLNDEIEEIAERVKLSAIAGRMVLCFAVSNGAVRVVKPQYRFW